MIRKILWIFVLTFLLAGCDSNKSEELTVLSVKPDTMKRGESSLLEIYGKGFQQGSEVYVGEQKSAQVSVSGEGLIIALMPDMPSAGVYSVRVVDSEGREAIMTDAVTLSSDLEINAVRPEYVQEGDTSSMIRIIGSGFKEGAEVFFSDMPASRVKWSRENLVMAWPPLVAPGVKDVKVKNPDGSETILAGALEILSQESEVPVQPFKELASEMGIDCSDDSNVTGVSFADINMDGKTDVVTVSGRKVGVYLKNEDGGFDDVSEKSGIQKSSNSYGAFFGDFDNDGLPDLLLSGQPIKLFHNSGDARFEEVTERVGLPLSPAWLAAWADYNNDGMLDLFIGQTKGDDQLFENVGGSFKEVHSELFEKMAEANKLGNKQPTTFSASFADYNKDSFVDIFVGIRGQSSKLVENVQGKTLKDVTEEVGIAGSDKNPKHGTFYKPDWGVTWVDYDNDSYLDLFSTSGAGGLDLFKNDGGAGFTEVTERMRVLFTSTPLCPAWGDFDNDGRQDLAISDNLNGVRVYRNKGGGRFEDVTVDLNISTQKSSPMAIGWCDLDKDGGLDLYSAEYFDPNRLYMNGPFPGRHYLEVKLEGTKDNSMAIGSVVTVEYGGTVLTRQLSGGEAYLVSPCQVLHFGLGGAGKVDKLSVKWPSGDVTVRENVKADQVIEIKQEGERRKLPMPPVEEKTGSAAKDPDSGN